MPRGDPEHRGGPRGSLLRRRRRRTVWRSLRGRGTDSARMGRRSETKGTGVRVPKASEADKDRFRSAVPVDPRVEVKPMFGNLGAFVNGNMFAGLFGPEIGVKLASADMAELADAGGGPFGPEERP